MKITKEYLQYLFYESKDPNRVKEIASLCGITEGHFNDMSAYSKQGMLLKAFYAHCPPKGIFEELRSASLKK